jgi:type IV pilus assembly protein PilA
MYKKWLNHKNNKKGFTLVELIVVLVILAILAAILVPTLIGYIDKARLEKDYSSAQTVRVAVQAVVDEMYGADELKTTTSGTTVTYDPFVFYSGTTGTKTTTKVYGSEVATLSGVTQATDFAFNVNAAHVVTDGWVEITNGTAKSYYVLSTGNSWSAVSSKPSSPAHS